MGTLQFGTWLRRQIEEQLITISDFSRKAGSPRPTVDTWISGRYRPRGHNVVRISRTLGISRDEVQTQLDCAATAA